MYPQNSRNTSAEESPLEHGPEQTSDATTSAIPQPVDAWPPREDATGDNEPATAPATVPSEPKKRSGRPKPWIFAAIIVAALIVLGGVGAAAYTLYESPQKVIADSVAQLVTAKSLSFTGDGSVKAGSTNFGFVYNGASVDQKVSLHTNISAGAGAGSVAINGDVISNNNGDYYLKIANIKDIMASFLNGVPAQEQAGINQVVAKVDNKWIKVSASDVPMTTTPAAAKLQQCTRTAFGMVQTDASYRDELTNLYAKQQFIVVKQKLGVKNMAIGYRLGVDAVKERAFIDSLSGTKLYGDLKKCDSTFNFDGFKVSPSATLPEAEIWSNIFTHQPKQLTIMSPSTSGSSTYAFTVHPVLNPSVSIDIPADTTDVKQLQGELLGLSMATYGSTTTP